MTAATPMTAGRVGRRRSSRGFSIATILRSSVDTRAIRITATAGALPGATMRAICSEMIGVGGGADAGLQHGVVAGQLAVVAQRAAGEPGQRVPPEQRAQRLGDRLEKPVVAHDVRHLVRQHGPHALVAPAQPARGDHHARPAPAPCRKQQGLRRDEQAHGPAERRVTADGIERLAPAHILHHHRLRDQAAEAHDGDEQPAERDGGARAPEGESQGRPAHAGGDRRIGLRDRRSSQPSQPSVSRPSQPHHDLARRSPPGARRRGRSAQPRRA